ncbi:hypothetical protein HZ326_0022 [Fusarium oxysporum f. sp. albedinis]|nr:hypothetical protein HZ326_0022 [Fusarium oxysporum f. sp. albedinis]
MNNVYNTNDCRPPRSLLQLGTHHTSGSGPSCGITQILFFSWSYLAQQRATGACKPHMPDDDRGVVEFRRSEWGRRYFFAVNTFRNGYDRVILFLDLVGQRLTDFVVSLPQAT